MELRIKEILSEKGITQKELCEMLGKSKQYVSNIVNGRGSISVPVLEEIAKVLSVPVASLFADYDKKPENAALCPHCGKAIKLS